MLETGSFLNILTHNHTCHLPIGETLILFIQLQGDFDGTEFTEAILLAIDGDTIESLNMTNIGNGEYATPFVTPSQPFLIQISGSTISNGNPITRISASGVETTEEAIGIVIIIILQQ